MIKVQIQTNAGKTAEVVWKTKTNKADGCQVKLEEEEVSDD